MVAVKTGEIVEETMDMEEAEEAATKVEEVAVVVTKVEVDTKEMMVAAGVAAEVDTREVDVVEVATETIEVVATETEEAMEEETTTESQTPTTTMETTEVAGADNLISNQREKATPKDSAPEEEEAETTSEQKQHPTLDKMLRSLQNQDLKTRPAQ